MVRWADAELWTAHGHVFDIGITTSKAIQRLRQGTNPELAGGIEETENGNGSLMRILPLLLLLLDKPVGERFRWVHRISGLTHGHVRSVMACFYYLELARLVWQVCAKREAYHLTNESVGQVWATLAISETEQHLFERLLNGRLDELPDAAIRSDGYVLHTLEASVWCWLTTNTYADTVLKAVNLGSDTDT